MSTFLPFKSNSERQRHLFYCHVAWHINSKWHYIYVCVCVSSCRFLQVNTTSSFPRHMDRPLWRSWLRQPLLCCWQLWNGRTLTHSLNILRVCVLVVCRGRRASWVKLLPLRTVQVLAALTHGSVQWIWQLRQHKTRHKFSEPQSGRRVFDGSGVAPGHSCDSSTFTSPCCSAKWLWFEFAQPVGVCHK